MPGLCEPCKHPNPRNCPFRERVVMWECSGRVGREANALANRLWTAMEGNEPTCPDCERLEERIAELEKRLNSYADGHACPYCEEDALVAEEASE